MNLREEGNTPNSARNPAVSAPHGADPEDIALIAKVLQRDQAALRAVYDRYSPLVYGLSRRVTGSAEGAEDVTQEVFVFLWDNAERFDGERGSLRAFLGALAHRRSVDLVRRTTRRSDREERVGVDPSVVVPMVAPDERAADDDLHSRVRRAVAALPREQMDAVRLAYFGGFTFREVADHLGIPEGTAKSRLRLALHKLGALLEQDVAL